MIFLLIVLTQLLTLANAWKPASVNIEQPATSSVFSWWHCWAKTMRHASVKWLQPDKHKYCKFLQFSAKLITALSSKFWQNKRKIRDNRRKNSVFLQMSILTLQPRKFNVSRSWQDCAKMLTARSVIWVQPLAMKDLILWHPCANASIPAKTNERSSTFSRNSRNGKSLRNVPISVTLLHHEILMWVMEGHPLDNAFNDTSVMFSHDVKSSLCNFGQNLFSDSHVLKAKTLFV